MLPARLALSAALVLANAAGAQDAKRAAGPPAAETTASTRVSVTRRSLAREYLRLERDAIAAQGRASDEQMAQANRTFDRATRFFFRGDYAEAIRAIHRSRATLDGRDPDAPHADGVEFLPDRLYLAVGQADPVNIAVRRLYSGVAPGEPTGILTLPCVLAEVAVPFRVPQDGASTVLRLAIPTAEPRICVPEAVMDATGVRIELPPIRVTRTALSDHRAALLKRLDALPFTPALARALATCRARVGLLTEKPIDTVTATFTLDLAKIADEADAELAAIEAGRDPYVGRTGDLWCVFDVGSAPTPMRLIVPDGLPDGPKALVIAVHGAGGDENLFADGYGLGIIKSLAAKHRVIVGCPAAGLMAPMPGYLDAILAAVKAWHDIDPDRVYLVGHSLGGGIVSAWAKARPDDFAGVVSIAGVGSFAGSTKLPRVLAIAGELDPLVTADRTREQAQIAQRQGLPVEFRQVDHYGHTLVVGKVLPEAFEWLMGGPKAE